MFKFDRKQEVFEFGKFKVGGQPGEYPTCCIGTMFYARHKIVSDPEHGVFDAAAAERLWNAQVEMSDITGNSCMNQIVAESDEAMKKEIDWFVRYIGLSVPHRFLCTVGARLRRQVRL